MPGRKQILWDSWPHHPKSPSASIFTHHPFFKNTHPVLFVISVFTSPFLLSMFFVFCPPQWQLSLPALDEIKCVRVCGTTRQDWLVSDPQMDRRAPSGQHPIEVQSFGCTDSWGSIPKKIERTLHVCVAVIMQKNPQLAKMSGLNNMPSKEGYSRELYHLFLSLGTAVATQQRVKLRFPRTQVG